MKTSRFKPASAHYLPSTPRTWLAVLGFAAASSLTQVSGAQDEQARANARAAANAGADAYENQDYVKAISYFERAESQFHSAVHLWYIARAAKEAGQLVKAREACMKVTREGAPQGSSESVISANEECEQILEALAGAIPSVTLLVEGVPQGTEFSLLRNGEEVPHAVVGIPAPFDPGEHTFTASALGYSKAEATVNLKAGDSETVTLTLTPTSTEGAPAPSDATKEGSSERDASSSDLPRPYWPAFVAWGAGLAGVGAGVVFGISSKNKADEADELCGGGREECLLDAGSADAVRVAELNNQAGTNKTMAIIGYGAGGAFIAGGVALWLLEVGAPRKAEAGFEPKLRPVLGLSHVGLAGTF